MTAPGAAVSALALLGLIACRSPEPEVAPPEVTSDAAPPEVTSDAALPEVASPAAGGSPRRESSGPVPERGAEVLLKAGERHEYALGELAAGDGVHVVLEQRGVDLVAEVLDGAGGVVLIADSPTGAHGFEHVCFIARGPGAHRLRLAAFSAAAEGSYEIRLEERAARSSNRRVRSCEDALRASAEAERRRSQASAEVAALYRRAIELWRRRPRTKSSAGEIFPLAVVIRQAGSFASRRGELDTALRLYGEALELLRGAGGESASRLLAAVLNQAGLALDLAGEPERARGSFDRARAVSREIGDRRGEAVAISNLARWETARGDLYRGVELHREALAIWRDLGRAGQEATTLTNLGVTLTRLGIYSRATDVLHDALEIRQPGAPPALLAGTWMAIGWVDHLSGDGEQAVERLLRAAALYGSAGAPLGQAGALDRLGSAYRELGRLDEARVTYQRSLAVYRASGDRLHTAHTASNLGCLLADPGLLEGAGDTFAALGDRAALAHVRFCQARRERDAGRFDSALRRAEEAVGLVDELRAAALRRGHHAPTLALWQEYSELHVDILMRLHEQHPDAGHAASAFEVSDLARARRLYEILLEARVDVRSGVPRELLERERAVQRRLSAAELRRRSLLQQEGADEGVAALEKTLRELSRELAGARAAIRTAGPRFAELRQPSPVRLAQVQQLLAPDTLLLSYVLGEQRGFLFVVSPEGIESHLLPARRRIDRLARRVWEGLRNSRQRRTRHQLPALARRLSDILLGPVRARLVDRRLLVVGDGMLHYVPFAALPLAGRGEDLVVERHEVVHLPSAAVMRVLRRRAAERTPAPRQLAVVADAVYSIRDDRLSPAVRAGGSPPGSVGPPPPGQPLLDLPHSGREAESILAMVAPEQRLAALGFVATPELVRGGVLSSYRILHFATHSLLHEENPELSGIALSMFDRHGRARDGYLRLHEIYALHLPADLVVLSACSTALTGEAQGAGLVGLAHGFFYAGASRLVVSLWDVHDEATAELMAEFYRGLLVEGLSPPAALRRAQRWMRRQERWRAAYYWAGFVLEGDWG